MAYLWSTARITNLQAKKLLKSYISCTKFGHSQFKAQNSSAGLDYHELKTGYDAMITVSNELVQVLQALT